VKFVLWVIVSAAFSTAWLPAQAAVSDDSEVDSILGESGVTWGDAAWLVGRAAGGFDDSVSLTEAAAQAVAAGWGSPKLTPATVVDLATYSQLLVRALHLPAGVLYRWFPVPRYAYRELVFRRIVPGALAPDSPVSGQNAMFFLQTAQTWKGSHP